MQQSDGGEGPPKKSGGIGVFMGVPRRGECCSIRLGWVMCGDFWSSAH